MATNNPYKYRITSVYTDVSVLGGTTGGSWSYTNTDGATSIVSVGIGETVIVAGNYSTFARTRGTGSTIVNGGQSALDGIFVTDDGIIKIGSDVGGTFSAVVVATNCVGNSSPKTFTFIVKNPSLLYKFAINFATPKCSSSAACAIHPTLPTTTLWFDGLAPCTYPVKNSYI